MFNTKYDGEDWTTPDIARDLKNRLSKAESDIQEIEFAVSELQGSVTALDKELRDNENLALAIFELQEAESKMMNARRALEEFKRQEEKIIAETTGPA